LDDQCRRGSDEREVANFLDDDDGKDGKDRFDHVAGCEFMP
jgi:hypothetical protein